jgi:hypothetical protein
MRSIHQLLRTPFSVFLGYQGVCLVLALTNGPISRAGGEELSTTNTQAASNGPRIQLAEDFFDFGRVEEGRLLQHDFAFTNTGNQVLEIQDVVTSCGCTTIGEWNRRVEPGKSGVIPIQLNTAGFSGPTLKNIKLKCNDPALPTVALYLRVLSFKQIDALPQVAAFSFGPDSQTTESRSIWITNHMEEPVTLEKPAWTNNTFQAELKTIVPGKVFQLLVTVVPPAPEGSLSVPITLKTSSRKVPEISVSAYSLVQPSISTTPPRIFLDSGPLKEPASFNIVIRNKGTNPLQLSKPVFPEKGVDVKLTETQPGREFVLSVGFPPGFKLTAKDKAEIRMQSNRPSRPWVTVPVVQLDNEDDAGTPGAAGTPSATPSPGPSTAGNASNASPAGSAK